jgi:hypothetical protein
MTTSALLAGQYKTWKVRQQAKSCVHNRNTHLYLRYPLLLSPAAATCHPRLPVGRQKWGQRQAGKQGGVQAIELYLPTERGTVIAEKLNGLVVCQD